MLVMQRWSIGHSRSRHGRHRAWPTTIAATRPDGWGSGEVARSLVGPKIAVTGTPTAAATCIAPESLDTTASQRVKTPASVSRSVRPPRSIASAAVRRPVAR